MMWPDDRNWQMTVSYLLALAVMGFVIKLVALLLPVTKQVERPHLFWLLLSPASHRRLQPIVTVRKVLLRAALLFGALVLSYWIFGRLVRAAHIRGIAPSYCAAPVLVLMSEALVAFMTVLWLPSGQLLPPIHNRPWRARSVADFWGNRWNLWVSDWARYAIFQRLRSRPVFALLLTFAVSGLLHEWVINVPLYFITGRVLFGTMMLYFLLQGVGVLVERRFKKHPRLRVAFVWLVVFAPAPLVINEGLLRTLHLWPQPMGIVQANTDPQRHSIFTEGPADVLDHATSEIASGSKLGIDATKKLAGEGFKRTWPPLIKMDAAVKAKVEKRFGGKLIRPHRLQHQPHDHVLREAERKREAIRKVCFYVIDNARKEGLVEHLQEWKFCGAVIPGYPAMHPLEEDFWPLFWKLYLTARAPDAGNIKRPPIS